MSPLPSILLVMIGTDDNDDARDAKWSAPAMPDRALHAAWLRARARLAQAEAVLAARRRQDHVAQAAGSAPGALQPARSTLERLRTERDRLAREAAELARGRDDLRLRALECERLARALGAFAQRRDEAVAAASDASAILAAALHARDQRRVAPPAPPDAPREIASGDPCPLCTRALPAVLQLDDADRALAAASAIALERNERAADIAAEMSATAAALAGLRARLAGDIERMHQRGDRLQEATLRLEAERCTLPENLRPSRALADGEIEAALRAIRLSEREAGRRQNELDAALRERSEAQRELAAVRAAGDDQRTMLIITRLGTLASELRTLAQAAIPARSGKPTGIRAAAQHWAATARARRVARQVEARLCSLATRRDGNAFLRRSSVSARGGATAPVVHLCR